MIYQAAVRTRKKMPKNKKNPEKIITINFIRLSSLLFIILLFPLFLINRINFNLNSRKKNPFFKSTIVKLIEKYPLLYDISTFVWDFPLYSKIYHILPDVSGKILHVGCGTGLLNRHYKKKKIDHSDMFNIDINFVLLKHGLKRNPSQIFVNANIYNVPIKDNFFDVIVFARCFHHIRNHKKAFRECSRLLRNNGIIIITDPVSLSINENSPSCMVNSALDGLIWTYSKTSFEKHLESRLPHPLKIQSIKYIRQVHITNYNLIYPHTDSLAIIKKIS